MLCDICKKSKAVIHYAEVINDKIKKLNLCEECAAAKGIGVNPAFSLGEFLSGLTGHEVKTHVGKKMCCPLCGLTMEEFKETGRLGCSQCYETFYNTLQPIIGSIHKGTRHIGKVPTKAAESIDLAAYIKTLEERLQEAVRKEEFELAAKLRDEIRLLQKKLDQQQGEQL